jgi:hypothetical protein
MFVFLPINSLNGRVVSLRKPMTSLDGGLRRKWNKPPHSQEVGSDRQAEAHAGRGDGVPGARGGGAVISRNKSPEVRKLDDLCRQYVFMRDRFLCVKCLHLTKRRNGDRLQWAHIYSRGVHSLRWEPDNSVVLCSGCHLHGHLHPLEFSRWFEEQYPDRVKYLTLLRQTKRKVDRVGMRLWLEQQIEKLEGK